MRSLRVRCCSPWSIRPSRSKARPALAPYIRPFHTSRALRNSNSLSSWPFPRFRFRFRPLPSYAVLLAGQVVIIYAVVHNLNEAGDDAFGEESSLLNTSSFTTYTLVAKESVSDNSFILTLQPTAIAAENARITDATTTNISETLLAWLHRVRTLDQPTLARQKEKLQKYQAALWAQGVWSVEIKQPQLMIARHYTPLPPPTPRVVSDNASGATSCDIRLFVRREPQGEVSRYLETLPVGAAVELRGGFIEFGVPRHLREIVFIAGGTGIAPALAVAHCLAANGNGARMSILWANRRREDCIGGGDGLEEQGMVSCLKRWVGLGGSAAVPSGGADSDQSTLVKQLSTLRCPGERLDDSGGEPSLELSTRYFIDEEGSMIQRTDIANALRLQRLGYPTGTDATELGPQRLVVVSGPDGFVAHVAGSKIVRGGVEYQGAVRGLLSEVDLRGWEVRKL